MKAQEFPNDEFDAAPEHGGRHRIRRTSRHRVLEFLKITAYSAIVALIGFGGLKAIDSLNFFDATTVISVQPIVDSAKPLVVVLDGTEQTGVATKYAKLLLSAGYNVGAAANYSSATGGKVATTVVNFVISGDRALAEALAKKIGPGVKAKQSSEFTDAVTVIIGTDLK